MTGRPALSPSYLRSLGASILSPPQRTSLLIILDLNGVLLERLASSGKSRAAHREAKALRPPSFRFDGRDIWLRPYHTLFLSYVAARHTLSVWSSATPKTVTGVLAHPRFLPQGVTPAFVHTRDTCVPDTVTGGHATLKPLSAVFTGSFAARNTLIFDDSPSKVVRDPLNAVILPDYSAGNLRVDYLTDETLLWAAVYLEHVARDFGAVDDVRERVREAGGLKGLDDFITDAQGVAIAESGVASCRVFLPGVGEGLDIAADEKAAAEVAAGSAPGIGGSESGKRWRRRRGRGLNAQNGGEADAEDRAIDDAEDAGIPQNVPQRFGGEQNLYGVDGRYEVQAVGSGERAVSQSFGGEQSAYGAGGEYGVQAAGSGERAGGWDGGAVQGKDWRLGAQQQGQQNVIHQEYYPANASYPQWQRDPRFSGIPQSGQVVDQSSQLWPQYSSPDPWKGQLPQEEVRENGVSEGGGQWRQQSVGDARTEDVRVSTGSGGSLPGQGNRNTAKAEGEVLASEFQRTNLSTEVEELPVLAGASRIPRA